MLAEELEILDEDERFNRAASAHAAEIVLALCDRRPLRLLSHCNAGHLATVAWGSALGVVWHLHERRGLVVPPKRSLQHTRGRAIAIRAGDWDRGQVEANIGIALSGLNAA